MKHPMLTAAIAALALASAPAIADQGKNKSHPRDRSAQMHHPGNNPKAAGRHDNGLHLGWYKQAWKRGDRIPVAYLEPRYYVTDYRVYRLAPPPPGYRWVRPMDDRYLLVQVTTGLILEALGY